MMHAVVIISSLGALFSSALAMFFVHRMTSDLLRLSTTEKKKSGPLSQVLGILGEHKRIFPASQTMLGFWVTLEYLLISLSCVVYGAIFRL